MTFLSCTSTLKPILEFCALNRNSVSLPAVVLLNGILPKFVPMPEPALVERKTAVKSMNPTGVIVAEPILKVSGSTLLAVIGWATAAGGGGSAESFEFASIATFADSPVAETVLPLV